MTDILKSPFVGGKTTEAEYKPRIYVCSPYRPRSQDPFAVKKELECNIDRAKTACRMVGLDHEQEKQSAAQCTPPPRRPQCTDPLFQEAPAGRMRMWQNLS